MATHIKMPNYFLIEVGQIYGWTNAYVESIKYEAKLPFPVAEGTTVHYFMCTHLNILSTCEHFLCLLLVSLKKINYGGPISFLHVAIWIVYLPNTVQSDF